MKRASFLLTALIFLGGCATTPFTDRKQFMVVSEDQEKQMGEQAFQEVEKLGRADGPLNLARV